MQFIRELGFYFLPARLSPGFVAIAGGIKIRIRNDKKAKAVLFFFFFFVLVNTFSMGLASKQAR